MKTVVSTFHFFGSLAGIAAAYVTFHPLTNFNPGVVGRWESDYSYPIQGGTLRFQGRSIFFHEGKYNVAGVITLEGTTKGQGYKYHYNVVGAGNWTADSKRMSITLQNMHSFARSIEVKGIELTPELAERVSGIPTPKLTDSYPDGMSDEYNLQSASPKALVLQGIDPFGKPFTIQMHRQS
ncbi:hypothetical protein [Pseudomonas sp. MWU12-2037]|uniref:hypothetical protein n=1 Tax=Pseudomonas sp. MWU12-2037 TaxID=2928690 RepID=UPI00200DDFEA|nr:hypothetical protein [Pseudomonas sp. MWU12-2037]